jgi:chromosome segregation ATPase
MKKKTSTASELVIAAQALDEELGRLRGLAEALGRQKLDSGSAVEKATKLLQTVSSCEADIGQRIAALSTALQGLGQQQVEQVSRINERAAQVNARAEAYQKLIGQYESLGQSARDLNAKVKPMLGGEGAELVPAMLEIESGARDLATRAGVLAEQAAAEQFRDVHDLADGLRQQLLAAINKLQLARARLPSA